MSASSARCASCRTRAWSSRSATRQARATARCRRTRHRSSRKPSHSFLEQTDLDPVTVFGDSDEAVAAEMVRASVERAAAQLAREVTIMGRPVGSPEPARKPKAGAREPESRRSHKGRKQRDVVPTTSHGLNGASTHWAITTVNVPDRLDLQEERDRAEAVEYSDGRRREILRVWMKRLLMVAVLAVIAAGVYATLAPLQEETSAARVSERLTAVFKRPVRVADSDFRFSPTPRLIVRGIDVGGQFKADEISLLINWKDLWSAVRGGNWVWSEALIAPMTVTPAQAAYIVRTLPGGARELPSKISTIRFASVRIGDSRLFPDAFEGVLRRTADGTFGPLVLRPLNVDGTMQLSFQARTHARWSRVDRVPIKRGSLDAPVWAARALERNPGYRVAFSTMWLKCQTSRSRDFSE